MRKIILAAALALTAIIAGGCGGSQADTVNHNLGVEAERFHLVRRIVGVNAITDKVLFEVVGRCSLEENGALPRNLEIIYKDNSPTPGGKPLYSKHFIGLSDNVTWVSTQLQGVNVSEFHTKFIFKPEGLIPDIDLVTSGG